MSATNDNTVPTILADRYRLETPVGEGAHATTWRGWDEKLSRPVAVKILRAEVATDPQFVQRFRDEARVAASVRQGNVVDVYDFGQEQGVLYIVMQFVDGQTLKSLIQQRAPLDPRETRRIIGHVLDGLQAIHAVGIVHRDIKPQNILIGRDGVAKVTDFGVAEVGRSSGMTNNGMTIGTVEYMAPEQAQGAELTPSADLYATGVILYEMLTGTLPFAGTSREIMLQHVNAAVTPPGVRMPQRGISPATDAVVIQSLAKDPQRRFANARAMKQAIGQALSDSASPNTQATSVIASQRPSQPAPVAMPHVDVADVSAGLNGAMKGIIAVILLGMLGVALWGAVQLLDNQGVNLSLPSLNRGPTEVVETPTPSPEGDSGGGVIEPINPEGPTPIPTNVPTEVPPTDVPPTEVPPTEIPPTEIAPIEPIDPEDSTELPAN
ncbi:MAG: protein kinase [Thermomicrobiales bacterium]|nr:protein kinase [Thermomicrobiales bacterium]